MSRGRAADLARFKVAHPMWDVSRNEDPVCYVARRGKLVIASASLERLALLIHRAGPAQADRGDSL